MGTRADNRDGSCREVLTGPKKGRWRVQFTQVDDLGRKRRLSRLLPNKTEAKAFLQSLRHGAKIRSAIQRKELTLAGWFDWLAENDWPESLDEKTIAIRKGRFNKYVRPAFGAVPLARIDPLIIRSFYKELRDKGVGQPTVLALKRDLVRVFNQAISPYGRVSMTTANPFRLVIQTPPSRDAVALEPDMARRALANPEINRSDRALLGLLLLGGLRLSEMMALASEQIRFDQDLIVVDRAVKIGKTGNQTIGLPKGDKTRLVVMCPTLKSMLAAVASERDGLLWPSEDGSKPRMKKVTYANWERIVKLTGLPPKMTPHDCRLTHINWIEKLMPSVSPTTLKEHVGHALQGVTEVNYTRPITPAQQLLRDEIERVAGLTMQSGQTPDSAPSAV